ncbi:DMT family transporter [Helicovermis profundi]|uniref:DMT family transporter n=1 Tax=Helicovermis profundi TaxID=3065157 RepID=A0AAU9E5E4_9FIRM|nr:DMT family transporter [Clostridia bacterium S502]
MTNSKKADLALLFVTFGWGSSFLLSKNVINQIEVFNFLWVRFLLAFVIAILIFYKRMLKIDKTSLINGFVIGLILFSGFAFQTVGLNITTVSKSAFITGLSVILVPVLMSFYKKKLPGIQIIVSVAMAITGLGLLTLTNGVSSLNLGDILTLVSSFLFAMHIISVGALTHKSDSITMAIIQIGTVGVLSLIASFIFEKPTINLSVNAWGSLIVLSVICTLGAFVIQSIAQKYTSSTHTALIYSMEPVFASIFSYIFIGEVLGLFGTIGALMIVFGMIVAELDFGILIRKKEKVLE